MPEYKDRSNMPKFARAVLSFIHMVNLRKNVTEVQKDEMYKLIRIHGFNEGFQKFLFAFDIDERKAKEQKESLVYNYSMGRFPLPPKEEEYIEPNYRPSLTEIKTFEEKYRQEVLGCTLTRYKRTRGWHIVVVESPSLERPKIFMSSKEKSGHVMEVAISFFVSTYKQLGKNNEPFREEKRNKQNNNRGFDLLNGWYNRKFK